MHRPFGCGVILGSYDRDGPQLYMIEPSGVSYKYYDADIGKGRQAGYQDDRVFKELEWSDTLCARVSVRGCGAVHQSVGRCGTVQHNALMSIKASEAVGQSSILPSCGQGDNSKGFRPSTNREL
ncbi:hypothetical protein AgCh_017110 [Apium graveolens]